MLQVEADKVRDGIADWIEQNVPHKEMWTPEVVELIRSIEIRADLLRTKIVIQNPQS